MEHDELVLERFHVALVASIERSNPNYLRAPFTIAEIYEDLIPYRTHRDLIGVAMNGDYEHGLLRLLAGQSDYLIVESPDAQKALAEELEKTAPDTGMFKRYGGVKVRLNPDLAGTGSPGQENTGVAKLFLGGEEPSPEPVRRWGLGADDKGPREEVGEQGVKAVPADEVVARKPKDEVGSSKQFWMESRKPLRIERQADEVPEGEATELETENRRLKILLAERVLEVEELREQLKKWNRGVLKDDS